MSPLMHKSRESQTRPTRLGIEVASIHCCGRASSGLVGRSAMLCPMYNLGKWMGLFLVCFAISTGCKKSTKNPSDVSIQAVQPATTPTTGPATAPTAYLFDDKKHGVQFRYPSNWISKPDND